MNLVRRRIFLLKCLVIVVAIGSVATIFLWHRRLSDEKLLPQPPLATIQRGTLRVGSLVRSYLYYAPPRLPTNSPMLIVLHGASENAQTIRNVTGNEFEALAQKDHFLVVYPNGYAGNWNDCRTADSFPARTQHIDDESFMQDLINHFKASAHINTSAVFAAGYSNGGQMAYRLALEMPQDFAGIAAISANLPTPSNNLCTPAHIPIPILIMTGTKDPISPYNGGVESLFGKQSRGTVLSSPATVQYFTTLNNQTDTPQPYLLPHKQISGNTFVSVTDYNQPDQKEVMDYTILNGGHVVPTAHARASSRLGVVTKDVDAPAAIWNFFSRQIQPATGPHSFTG